MQRFTVQLSPVIRTITIECFGRCRRARGKRRGRTPHAVRRGTLDGREVFEGRCLKCGDVSFMWAATGHVVHVPEEQLDRELWWPFHR